VKEEEEEEEVGVVMADSRDLHFNAGSNPLVLVFHTYKKFPLFIKVK